MTKYTINTKSNLNNRHHEDKIETNYMDKNETDYRDYKDVDLEITRNNTKLYLSLSLLA